MAGIRVNLLDFDPEALTGWLAGQGEKPFRARQLLRWMHQAGEDDFSGMSDLSVKLRARLPEVAEIAPPKVLADCTATDGTRKWMFSVDAANAVETVFIPDAERGTLCVSSQAGCALACRFCATGRQGFNRNLSTAEIIGQLWQANHLLGGFGRPPGERCIDNVVLMGMGEPLANFEAVAAALRLMLDDHAWGLSRRRVTVSTAGMVPAMDRLRDTVPVALAVSLHAPDDALRDVLVPLNQKYPLASLLSACRRYLSAAPRDFITFEYTLIEDINDRPEQARALVRLLADVPNKINLIPFNPFPGTTYRRPSAARMRVFQEILLKAGMIATLRKTRGEPINAACGQLAGQIHDKTQRQGRQHRQAVYLTNEVQVC